MSSTQSNGSGPSNASTTLHSSQHENESLLRRSMHIMSELFSPFSSDALDKLPRNPQGIRDRSIRIDNIPETEEGDDGLRPSVRDYHSISAAPSQVRVPKKVATPIRVEAKVWFANERTWISYLNVSILLGALSLALFNASRDPVARKFAYVYAAISIAVLGYGYVTYQRRITMIRKRDPGNFDQIVGPVIICVILFFAVLSNFIIRINERRRKAP